jgi:tagaturonate reductase
LPGLNRNTLSSGRLHAVVAAPNTLPEVRILQIGDGNFLRAFTDWMVDVANGAGLMNGRITIAQPLDRGIAGKLTEQDGLYTVLLRGLVDGKQVETKRVISCVRDALNPYAEWAAMLACAADPALRFVVSNTTEAGIAYVDEALKAGCPNSFPAKVTALLWERFQKLGDGVAAGLVFLPCELIEANGTKLRTYVLQHASAWGLPSAFLQWVERHNHFLNTLVDRIVPGYPANEAEALFADLGYEDTLLVAAEPFHLWVIEGPQHLADSLPLHKAGLDVVWTNDLQPYRTRKVRILNGAHTASALAAFSAGLDTVQSMIQDDVISRYLNRLMFDEIVPFVPLPDAERKQYAATIMERFANPYIRHELISIALNSVSKWQVRVLPTVKDYAREHGNAPKLLSFSLAALLNFYHGDRDAAGEYNGQREGVPYPIKDNPDVITTLAESWRGWSAGDDVSERVQRVLADTHLWGEDLNAIAGLSKQVSDALNRINAVGVKAAIAELL